MKRILIVDDSLTVRMQLAEAFEAAGLVVEACSTLAAARARLAAEPFALVILDVLLPDGDGIGFLGELRAAAATEAIPVMILSSEIEVRDRVRGMRTGAAEYVGKPYDLDYVLARGAELIRQAGGAAPASSERTVLAVDDSAVYRQAIARALEGAGYRPLLAATGEEGLRLAASARPRAMVIDHRLPGMDGPSLVRMIRLDAALRLMPCVLVSSSEHPADEVHGLDAGADAYVRKSEDLSLLVARLGALLRATSEPGADNVELTAIRAKKLLAVDDSPTFQAALADALRAEGYDVISVQSGGEAFQILDVERVDCILLDAALPGLSGVETCRRIKARPDGFDLPVIMVSAQSDAGAMIEAFDAGAVDYVAKSDDFEALKRRLRVQLRRAAFAEESLRVRAQRLRNEVETQKARAATVLAETRAALLADLEQKNRELAEARDALARASEFKSRFLANMSHELRTPLNAIIGFSELIEADADSLPPKQKRYSSNVLQSGRHLLTLVNDILDLARVEVGRTDLERQWLDLGSVVEAAAAALSPLSTKQGVRLELDCPTTLPRIHLDPVRMRQVIYNLLSNGMKFTPRGGTVRLSLASDGQGVTLVVRDTGVGIPEADIPRLFRAFERIEHSARIAEGTGLGLALTKSLVELHGGTIAVMSVVGQGTTFTIRLPRTEAPPPR